MARKLAVEVGIGPENNRVGNGENDDKDDEVAEVVQITVLMTMTMITLLGSINHPSMPGTGCLV